MRTRMIGYGAWEDGSGARRLEEALARRAHVSSLADAMTHVVELQRKFVHVSRVFSSSSTTTLIFAVIMLSLSSLSPL